MVDSKRLLSIILVGFVMQLGVGFSASEISSEAVSESPEVELEEVQSEIPIEEPEVIESEVESEVLPEPEPEPIPVEPEPEPPVDTIDPNFTGWIDYRVNGTGSYTQYIQGDIAQERIFVDYILIERFEYHENGNIRLHRVYDYYVSTGEYIKRKEYLYDGDQDIIHFFTYSELGEIQTEEHYYKSGTLMAILIYKPGNIIEDAIRYYESGQVKFDNDYDQNGTRIKTVYYYENGNRKYYALYHNQNTLSEKIYYDQLGKRTKHDKFDEQSRRLKQRLFYSSGGSRIETTWDIYGNITSELTWNTSGLRNGYRTFYSSGDLKAQYKYYSSGRVSTKRFYYNSGELSRFMHYSSYGEMVRDKRLYSNGVTKELILYHANGNRESIRRYSTSNVITFYQEFYTSGKTRRLYSEYYSNGKPRISHSYTFFSTGLLHTSKRTDYLRTGERAGYEIRYAEKGSDHKVIMSSPNATGYFKSPVRDSNAYVTCYYDCYPGHVGIDIGSTNKTMPIYATAPGTVILAANGCSATGGYRGNTCNGGAGNYVVVIHQYKGRYYFSAYMHLSKAEVKVGQRVTTNTRLGRMGNSGNSNGPHLHFELYEDTDRDGSRFDEVRTNPIAHVDLSGIRVRF